MKTKPSFVAAGLFLAATSVAPLAGTYIAGRALYGPVLTQSGLSGRLVFVDPPLGCPAGVVFNNAAQIAGRIGVIDAGDCSFVEKSANPQNAGAIGVVFISGRPGPPPNPVGVDPAIVIPSVTLTQFEGDPIRAALMDGAAIDITMRANSTENGFRWNLAESSPGIMFRDMWKPTCRGHPDRANHPFQTCSPTA